MVTELARLNKFLFKDVHLVLNKRTFKIPLYFPSDIFGSQCRFIQLKPNGDPFQISEWSSQHLSVVTGH